VGRVPNTEGIGLENVGIKVDRGFVPVGDFYETPVEGVFAVGDVVDSPMLAHVASKEGEIAVEHMAGQKPPAYRGAGKSVAVEKPEGLVKLLVETETREILGAHVVGAEATELIHEILLAKTSELLPEDIAAMTHAHPTLSEAVMEAARMAEGWVIHV